MTGESLTIDDIFARGDIVELRKRLSTARTMEAFQWHLRAKRERQPALADLCERVVRGDKPFRVA